MTTIAAGRARAAFGAVRSDLGRFGVAGCGLLIFLSLFAQWAFDRARNPAVALNAWQYYPRVAVVLTLLAIVAIAGAAVGGTRWRGSAALLAGVGAVMMMLALSVLSDPGRGARLALLLGVTLTVLGVRELPKGDPRALRVWNLLTLTPLLALPITIAAFPTAPLAPGGGTDGSWVTALHVAAARGLDWGTDVVYTYGPLGYLTVPRLYYATQGTVAVVYVAIAYYALACTVLAAARRSFPLPLAAGLAFITSSFFRLISPDETTQFAVVAIAFCLGFAALRDDALGGRRWYPYGLAGGAVLAAFHALIKLNAGLTIVLIGLVVAACARPGRRLRDVALFGGTFAVALTLIWLLALQSLGALPDYLRYSLQIINGYAGYQYNEEGGREWEYLALPLVIVAVSVGLWEATRGWRRDRLAGAVLLTALVAFSLFKQGFVRHDGHSFAFFAVMLAAGIGIGWRRNSSMGLLGVGVLLIAVLGVTRPLPYELVRVRGTLNVIREHVRILRAPEPWIAQQRQVLRDAEGVDATTLGLVRGHSVHFHPGEAALAWAYPDLEWKPLPVFQGFQAYTRRLDELNAATLRAPGAPERLLRSTEYSPFEDPEANVEVLCRYVELRHTDRWQVLGRVPNRCGPLRSLGRVRTQTEALLRVPSPDPREIVGFRVSGFGLQGFERLRSFLYKPLAHNVMLDDKLAARLAPDLGESRNVVAVGSDADYGTGFRYDLGVDAIRFRLGAEGFFGPQPFRSRALTVEWFAIPVIRPGVD